MSQANWYKVSWPEVFQRLLKLPKGKAYGIPRGGAIIAGLLGHPTENPHHADFIVDDIIDSGKTAKFYTEKYQLPVFALINKMKDPGMKNIWVIFPWEADPEQDIADTVIRQLQFIGEDPMRNGLKDTPLRVVKSWQTLYGGYQIDPEKYLVTFPRERYDSMVILKNTDFFSTCEHHMLPFFGKAHIAYIPGKKVIGISKLARILEAFSRRLQVQERLTEQITAFLMKHIEPQGAACVLEATHFCMTARGVSKQRNSMITSSLKGVFANQKTRAEFLNLIGR